MTGRLIIGSDHAGFALKESIKAHLAATGSVVEDVGAPDDRPVDYPGVARAVANRVASSGGATLGMLVCGSGIGMSIAANRVAGVRAALCFNREFARLSRAHNDANVLVLPGRFMTEEEAAASVDAFLATSFEGGRHDRRVKMIDGESCA